MTDAAYAPATLVETTDLGFIQCDRAECTIPHPAAVLNQQKTPHVLIFSDSEQMVNFAKYLIFEAGAHEAKLTQTKEPLPPES